MKRQTRMLAAMGVLAALSGCWAWATEGAREMRRARREYRLSLGQCRFARSEIFWWSVAGVGGAVLYTGAGGGDTDVAEASVAAIGVGWFGGWLTGMELDRRHSEKMKTQLLIGPTGVGLAYRF